MVRSSRQMRRSRQRTRQRSRGRSRTRQRTRQRFRGRPRSRQRSRQRSRGRPRTRRRTRGKMQKQDATASEKSREHQLLWEKKARDMFSEPKGAIDIAEKKGILRIPRAKKADFFQDMFDIHTDESVELKKKDIASIEKRLNYKETLSPVAHSTKKKHDKKGEATIIRSCIDFLKHLVRTGKLTWGQADKIMEIIPNTAHWGRYTGEHSKDQKDILIAVMNYLWSKRTTPDRNVRRSESPSEEVTSWDKLQVRLFHGDKSSDYETTLPPTPPGQGRETSKKHLLNLAAQEKVPELEPGKKKKESGTPHPRGGRRSMSPAEPEPDLDPHADEWWKQAEQGASQVSPFRVQSPVQSRPATASAAKKAAPAARTIALRRAQEHLGTSRGQEDYIKMIQGQRTKALNAKVKQGEELRKEEARVSARKSPSQARVSPSRARASPSRARVSARKSPSRAQVSARKSPSRARAQSAPARDRVQDHSRSKSRSKSRRKSLTSQDKHYRKMQIGRDRAREKEKESPFK